MPAETLDRYPRQFSGGQRQRIAIARALVTHPKLVICDEAVSALDLSVQAQVLNLLRQVQRQVGIAMLFITHDLSVVRHVSDQIAVLLQGRIMELGPAEAVCTAPAHPYTQALIAAAPIPDPVAQRRRREVLAELVRPADATTETATVTKSGIPGSGCPFAPRCPRRSDVCFTSRPRLTTVESGVKVACHLATAAEVGL
jgi:peptide/nickel transport system ATP-binding protein